jgi:septal ring-binding cell division protein DamX
VTSPFFLTRQSANLMEDFTRELKAGAALFLLYGESDVGKTRLLQELSQNRLADRRVHWLDLNKDNDAVDSMHDHAREIETVFASAQQGDIIIADHFEMSLKKARHQLFLSWSTDGVDKQLNLIIASSTEGFDELRQLSQQYQVAVQSFQQMPFSADEVNAFVGFYLFPENPMGKLSIPATLRKQLAATGGAAGKVIEILARDGAQIGSSPMADTGSMRLGSRITVTALILLVLAFGAGWYYLDNQSAIDETLAEVAAIESEPLAIDEPEVEPVVETEVEPVAETETVTQAEVEPASEVVATVEAEVADEKLTGAEPEVADEKLTGAESEVTPEDRLEVENVTVLETDNVTEAAAQGTLTAEPGTASDTDAVLVEPADLGQQETALADAAAVSEQEEAEPGVSNLSRFQRELEMSHDWIASKAESVGTMQILMLSFKTFDEAVYYEYVDSLARKQVDTTQLRIFKTYTGGAEVYSVFFGEYASRKAALKAKDDLPEVLRKISPIPRSVGGILQEIRRLEAES